MQKRENPKKETSVVNNPDFENDSDSFILRAVHILDCLSDGVDTITGISKQCNLSTSTTHRILRTLIEPRIAVYDPSHRRYYLGPFFGKLIRNSDIAHRFLTISALSEMKRLLKVAEETVTLDSVIGVQYVHLHALHSRHSLKVQEDSASIRELMPVLPVGASQKVLCSQLGEYEQTMALKIAAHWIYGQDKPKSDVINDWKNQLNQIKTEGYVVTRGESIPGGLGVSFPVFNYINPVALTVLGPEKRMENLLQTVIKELSVSAAIISQKIADVLVTPLQ